MDAHSDLCAVCGYLNYSSVAVRSVMDAYSDAAENKLVSYWQCRSPLCAGYDSTGAKQGRQSIKRVAVLSNVDAHDEFANALCQD